MVLSSFSNDPQSIELGKNSYEVLHSIGVLKNKYQKEYDSISAIHGNVSQIQYY